MNKINDKEFLKYSETDLIEMDKKRKEDDIIRNTAKYKMLLAIGQVISSNIYISYSH